MCGSTYSTTAASPRRKAMVDLFGALFLLIPFAAAILYFSWPYVARSWANFEGSREASGLPLVFVLKTLIPVFAAMLILQGIAQAIRACVGAVRQEPVPQDRGLTWPKRSRSCWFFAICVALFAGYPVAFTLGGLVAGVRGGRKRARGLLLRISRRITAAHFRRDDQRGAAGDPALHLHGRDARALAHRRGSA